MPWDVLIRGGQVVTPDGVRRLDVAVEEGKIVELEAGLRGLAMQEIDAGRLHIFPGVIDAHVHFNEPGRADWEGFDTGSAALAAGGGTCFFDMPLNASPPTLDGASFDLKLAAAQASSRTDFALWGGLTPDNLDRMEELAERGVVGFKAFMSNSGIEDFGRADDLTLYRGMQIAARCKLPVAVHAESEELTSRLSAEMMAAGQHGVRDYLNSRPIIAEVDAIRRAIAFARETGCSLHIVHCSSAAGVREVADAKRSGQSLDITVETCPHYLMLCDTNVERMGAPAKCAPPLRKQEETAALWLEVLKGEVDLIGSDHSPAPASMKSSENFFRVWGGIAGVQSTLAILLTLRPPLATDAVAKMTASHVAARFGMEAKGRIEIGFDADLALLDLDNKFELKREGLFDRHKLSPYVGSSFRGVVKQTIVRGNTIFSDGKFDSKFRGRLVKPKGAKHA